MLKCAKFGCSCYAPVNGNLLYLILYSAWPLDSPLLVCYLCRCPLFGWDVRHFSLFLMEARIVPSVLDHWRSRCFVPHSVRSKLREFNVPKKETREKKSKNPTKSILYCHFSLLFVSLIIKKYSTLNGTINRGKKALGRKEVNMKMSYLEKWLIWKKSTDLYL